MSRQEPNYQSRVKKRRLEITPPKIEVPHECDPKITISDPLSDPGSGLKGYLLGLAVGLIAVIGFSMIQGYLFIEQLFVTHWFLASVLSILLAVFVMVFSAIIFREWLGFRSVKSISQTPINLTELAAQDDKQATLKTLKQRQKIQAFSPLSNRCYAQFEATIKAHHSNAETLKIFQNTVAEPLLNRAHKVLKAESVAAGGISLISPNSLLQTFGILWISLRTLRKISLVYGVKPSLIGNVKLLRIALENLAAHSLTDLVTDEVANQLGVSIAGKVMANSVDAVTAYGLNQRLGKALIRELVGKS